jgi:ribulose-5-phosphate 4-epimerase/fuculose-1-phosphate aldolase
MANIVKSLDDLIQGDGRSGGRRAATGVVRGGRPPPQRGSGTSHESDESVKRDLVAAHRLSHHHGFDELVWNHISARTMDVGNSNRFLVTPGDLMFDEVDESSLVESSPANINVTSDVLHAAIYKARPDVRAIVHHHTTEVVAVACMQSGLRYLTQDGAGFFGKVAYHNWEGISDDYDECARVAAALGPTAHTLLMRNHGAITVGTSVAEAWIRYYYLDRCCRVQVAAGSAALHEPDAAVLAHAAKQYDGAFAHGKMEWAALLRLAARLRDGDGAAAHAQKRRRRKS